MADTLSIAQSALRAAQAGLNTTGQNISNANTAGYSRQSVIQATAPSVATGMGYIGQGTYVADIKRSYDLFLADQRLAAQANNSQLQTQLEQMQQMDNLLSDSASGLSPALQNFFSSIQDVSLAPADASRRQAFFASANTLVSSFHSLNDQLENINQAVNQQLAAGVDSLNGLASQLADLNQAIQGTLSNGSREANDLLDKRDQLLLDISKLAKVSVVRQDNATDVYIGNGQPLVVGNNVYTFKLITDNSQTQTPGQFDVAYDFNGSTTVLTANNLAGGELGGLLAFRSEVFNSARTQIDALATSLSTQLNTNNQAGITANGTAGQDLFALTANDPHAASAIVLLTQNIQALAAASGSSGSSPAAGNNGNLQALQNLQTQPLLNNNSDTFQQAFARVVGQVGSKTNELQKTSAAASSILQHTQDAVGQVSGVNLDEEAANLIRYQQAYQAAGKLVQISKEMFDSLLQIA